jgi:hypothetical protein
MSTSSGFMKRASAIGGGQAVRGELIGGLLALGEDGCRTRTARLAAFAD